MIATPAKIFIGILGLGSSLTAAGFAGKLIFQKPKTEIGKTSTPAKTIGKTFEELQHDWTKENTIAPYALFKCVVANSSSCDEIKVFQEMTFGHGDNVQEIFKCTELTPDKKIPLYYFDYQIKDTDKPKDLDWTKLKRATAVTKNFGKYVVLKISQEDMCEGKIEKSTITADTNFWKTNFLIDKDWDEKNNYSKDLTVYIKENGTRRHYWWKPIAVLRNDFDVDLIEGRVEKIK